MFVKIKDRIYSRKIIINTDNIAIIRESVSCLVMCGNHDGNNGSIYTTEKDIQKILKYIKTKSNYRGIQSKVADMTPYSHNEYIRGYIESLTITLSLIDEEVKWNSEFLEKYYSDIKNKDDEDNRNHIIAILDGLYKAKRIVENQKEIMEKASERVKDETN